MNYSVNQRRLRASAHIRDLAATVSVSHKEMIQPLFVDQALKEAVPIPNMSGVCTDSPESVLRQIEKDVRNGATKFLLFPVPASKYETDFNFDFAADLVASIKRNFGDQVWLASDVCLCSYTAHGHCGVLNEEKSQLLNDETVQIIARYALQLAQAGADCVAPSDMTDGRIGAIRSALSEKQEATAIMSYSSKFSSSFYGPFRDVCKSAPDKSLRLKDRSSYQLDFRNPGDAVASSLRDLAEGADLIMVKPCLPYLDIVVRLRENTLAPIAVYHVSGEYASIDLMHEKGLINRDDALFEIWTAAKRAGATMIITYAARSAKKILEDR